MLWGWAGGGGLAEAGAEAQPEVCPVVSSWTLPLAFVVVIEQVRPTPTHNHPFC